MTYYQILNIPVSIQPNLIELKKQFISLSKQFHPDRFGNANEAIQMEALVKSSTLNQAYETLNDADKAMQYYLQHQQIIQTDEEYKLPADFLMEMMEINEELEFADASTKEKIVAETNSKKNVLSLQIIQLSHEAEPNTLLIKEQYYKLKYYKRLIQ
jgi:molecular chaperone HscB